MTQQSTLAQLIELTKGLRSDLAEELATVSPQQSGIGSAWGLADIVRHIGNRSPSWELIQKRIAGEPVAPPPRFDPEAAWRRNINAVLDNMAYLISIMEGMKNEDLDLTLGEGENVRTVRGMLEFSIDHYNEHLNEIRRLKPTVIS